MTNYLAVRSLLVGLELPELPGSSAEDAEQDANWPELWSAVAACLVRYLEADRTDEFEKGFHAVRDAFAICEPRGRAAAAAALFGDFTRRAISHGIDRTRFVDWFGPADLFKAPPRRLRGRVLYFNSAKGRGKILGSNRVMHFVHFSAIQGTGFRMLAGGEFVEFTPWFGPFNGQGGMGAADVVRLNEEDGTRHVDAR